jgi:hypothetical protein
LITENLSTLKIHKLTQSQYDRELAAGRIDKDAIYLTPYEDSKSGGFVAQPEEPEDTSLLWIDTDDNESENTIPTFDLYEMGLPPLTTNEEYVVDDVDCTALRAALSKGFVRLKARFGANATGDDMSFMVSGSYYEREDAYQVTISGALYDASREDPVVMLQGFVGVGPNSLYATYRELQKALPEWTGGSY